MDNIFKVGLNIDGNLRFAYDIDFMTVTVVELLDLSARLEKIVEIIWNVKKNQDIGELPQRSWNNRNQNYTTG